MSRPPSERRAVLAARQLHYHCERLRWIRDKMRDNETLLVSAARGRRGKRSWPGRAGKRRQRRSHRDERITVTDNERKAIERGEKRDRKVREVMELLDAGVEEVLDREQFKRYLASAARFHRYSANNTMLVLLQRPNATRVAGYRRWQELGRQVRRGEEGLKILAPITRTVEDKGTGEKARVLCSFKVVKVFDVSQTDPLPGAEPMPEKPRPQSLRGDSGAARALGRLLLAFCGSAGVPVSEDDAELDCFSPGAKGLYHLREKRILLRSALPADQRTKTLAHELAHHPLHRDADASEADRPAFEAEAEGAAYAVLSYFGVDASEYSFAYVARWAESKDVVKAALAGIQKVVREIIQTVEGGAPRAKGTPEREAA